MSRVHFSQLKNIRISPAHFWHELHAEREDSEAMRVGRAVHSLALEGIAPTVYEGIRRGKDWEAFQVDIAAQGKDAKDILSVAEAAKTRGMAQAVQRHRHAMDILSAAEKVEHSWEATICGLDCAGKIDIVGALSIDELKTAACVAPGKFLRDADRMWYDAQLAFYQLAMGVEWRGPDTEWMESRIIAVESKPPYVVQVYKLDNLRLDQGAEKAFGAIRLYRACMESGEWPAYSGDVLTWDGDIRINEEEEE